MIEIPLNDNFFTHRCYPCLNYIIYEWTLDNSVDITRCRIIYLSSVSRYTKGISCSDNASALKLKAAWSDDDSLYVLSPKFEYIMRIPPGRKKSIINWCVSNNITEYNIYYNHYKKVRERFISFGSLPDITQCKLTFA